MGHDDIGLQKYLDLVLANMREIAERVDRLAVRVAALERDVRVILVIAGVIWPLVLLVASRVLDVLWPRAG